MSNARYNIGDILTYEPFGGGRRKVRVIEKESDIKNGRAGFAGELLNSDDEYRNVWGYDSQILWVIKG